MSERFKLVYLGACSHRFSIGLFRNMLAATELHPMEIVLVDIDEGLLKYVHRILENMSKKAKVDIKVESTTDRHQAVENADFVFLSMSVGGQESEWTDIHIPLKFGMPQNTGDTVGPGGIFRALRCIPSIVSMVRDINEVSPKAVLLNYTNPMATLMLAARTAAPNVQSIGLCHGLFGGMETIKDLMSLNGYKIEKWTDANITYGGINHLAWLMSCSFKGEDIFPLIHEKQEECYKNNYHGMNLSFYLLGKYGLFTYAGDRHVAEFIPRYYNYFNYLDEPFNIKIRAVNSLDMGHKWTVLRFIAMSKDWYKKRLPPPNLGGERAMQMTVDWRMGKPKRHVVNIPNQGLIPNLVEDCIVEVPGYFDNGRISGVKVGKLPAEIAKIVNVHAKNQRLIVEAALKGDKEILLKALLSDPMCAFIDDTEIVEDMMNVMLYYQKSWLPKFEDVPSIQELKKRRWIDPKELSSKDQALRVKYPPRSTLKANAWPQTP